MGDDMKSGGKRVKAYVLIETSAGKAKAVKRELTRLKAGASTMMHLDGITGPYDFIAIVEGPSLDEVGRLVTDGIGTIDGVTRTTTCVAVSIG
jgi:DNA-binding Lrp family transcriptional regulator